MFKALITDIFRLRNMLTCLSVWKSQNLFKKVLWNLLIKTTRADYNHYGLRRNMIGEDALSKTNRATNERADKCRKLYVDHSKSELKKCLIHGHGHYSDECKCLGDFGVKHAKGTHDKDHEMILILRGELIDSW